ncbi:MAG: sodium:solute symporter family transporter, partial [Candidatus Eiseniibacteriota bacterium]
PIASLPGWVHNWQQVAGMLTIKDTNGDGILQLSEFVINQDIIVLSMPEIAGLPYVISGLVAAGGLAAALSTADGLLLAIANALSHDVYYKMVDPHASTRRRLIVARTLLVAVALIAAYTAGTRPSGIIQMVAWAFSLAAAGLFAPLVLGIWWKRTNAAGAVCGMIAGFGVCLFYLVMTRYAPNDFQAMFGTKLWWGINNISCGIFGIPVAFIVTYVVSKMTAAPSREMMAFVDSIRTPRGEVAWSATATHD